ncbi:MAG: tetratricopeptide repeat protein [Proteobacteria bacterium]|nr:tetratricopeptide repeat protein [Pseudomonadota bacterium]
MLDSAKNQLLVSSKSVRALVLLATVIGSYACGSGSNVNKIWGKEDNGGDSLMVESQAAFDAGDFARAESLARKLTERNPENESAAILLGFIHLSQGGVDAFTIARKLVALSPTTKASGTTSTNLAAAATTAAEPDTTAAASASDAAGILASMSSLVTVSDADKALLNAHIFGKSDNGDVAPQLFVTDNALVVPALVNDDLRSKIAVLNTINTAIKDVCRFVDDDVKVKTEARESGADCTATPFPRENAAKAHFLWVLAHLSEALVFQPVILYTTPANAAKKGSPSLTAVSTSINTKSLTTVDEFKAFAGQVLEVKNAVGKVFNTTETGSMVQATLQDLNAVSLGFGRLAGIPPKLQDSITKAFNTISGLGKELGAANVVNNTAGFKAQMIQNLSKNIGSQIQAASDKAAASGVDKTASKAQIQAMCDSYAKLNAGSPPSATTTVKACS